MINDILEAIMIVCFGFSWPLSIRKSYVSRTAKGKSGLFEILIEIGYIAGIINKILVVSSAKEPLSWVFYLASAFYVLNFTMVAIDLCLWVRNRRLDKEAGR